ncbi:MAG: hypothetical protein K2U26_18010, partial [Cyclobacteriaceae bacterium]|nr:hypothetical protein [Cyclobacteriaceae bacterium]
NSRYYRFTTRLRRNAAGNLTVNVMESSTLRSSTIANYSSASVGQWKYMEVLLDVGAVTGPSFTLDVQVPESTDFDYFALYPQRAELSSQVVHPLFGKLSETNARGLTAFTEYDRAGRVKYLKDQDKNIVQLNEYQYKVQPVSVSAAFYVSAFSLGRQVDFTAFGNCATSGLSYQWYVNDVAIAGATLSVFSYVFTADFPRVKLEVSHAVFGSASSEITLKQSIYYPPSSYIPPPTCTKTISISVQGDSVMRSCEDGGNPSRALRAFVSATDCSGPAEVFWEYLFPASMNSFVPYPSSGGLDFLFQFYRPALFDPIRSTPDSPVQTQVGFGAIPQNVYIRARVLMGNLQWAESNVISLQVINEGFCD